MADPIYPGAKIEVSGGTFRMGSTDGDSDEQPVREVTLSPYWLAETEVTVGQYEQYRAALGQVLQWRAVLAGCGQGELRMEASAGQTVDQFRQQVGRFFTEKQCASVQLTSDGLAVLPDVAQNRQGPDYPVVGVTKAKARAFCQYYGGDLQTAAQYERAAKGPSGTAEYGTPKDTAVVWTNGAQTTAPVCGAVRERENEEGFCDLAGNVWEWVLDDYGVDFYTRMAGTDPVNGPTANGASELRGGSWIDSVWNLRAAYRSYDLPETRYDIVGLRCAWPQDSKK